VRRMRVRCAYCSPNTQVGPPYGTPNHSVNAFGYGEAEDYNVNLGFAISTPSPLPTGAQGTAYSIDLVAVNGVTPYIWQGSPSYLIAGALPAGLTASPVGNNLRISGTPTGTGTANFTVSVNDSTSGTPKNSTKAYQLTVVPPPAAMPFLDDFSTDKGWQLPAPWSRGVATAFSQASPACSEPGTDHSASADNRIIGDTIGGKYAVSQSSTIWAVSPMVNCAGATYVRLRFWRWLGLAIGSTVKIEVTNNGNTWVNVWTSTSGTTYGGSTNPVWSSEFYDITTQAAGFATVQVRFGIGPTGTVALTGWCIDDFLIEQPGADMEVRETGSTGPTITDNQAVGGGRNFGTIGVSQQSPPLTIYITNNGPTNITFGVIAKIGAQPTDFYLNASSMTNPLPPGVSTSFTITFYRTTAGTSTATIQIPHNAAFSGTSPFEINVQGTAIVPQPIIRVNLGSATGPQISHQQSPAGTPRDFGNQDIGAGPTAEITLFITNAGTGTLSISTPDMGGTWWTEYIVNSAGMTSQLAAGASTSFKVSFDPSSIGQKNNTYVRIAHTDGTQASPFYVPVDGNGTSSGGPTLKVHEGLVTGPQIPHNDPAANGRDFGNQLVAGGATAALTITIENSGGASMTVGTPVLAGTNPTEFVLSTAGFQTSLTPGANTSFTVSFDPSSVGVKLAQVTFTHNDTNVTSPFIVNLRGNGVTTAPSIEVRENGAGGAQLTNPAPATGILDFGTQDINAGPTAAATIYVENTGTANLTLGIPSFASPTTEFQLQVAGFAGSVAPAGTATFTITFDPTSAGTHTAVVEFTHNDAAAGTPFVLNLTGDAVLNAPQLEVREGTTIGPVVNSGDPAIGTGRDCGSVAVGNNGIPVTIVIMNTGTQNLNMGTPTLGGNNAADFTLITAGFSATVAPGNNTQVSVSFTPALAGMKDCTVQFTHDDPGAPSPFVLNFVGTGTDPNAVLITTPSLPAAIPDMSYGPMQIEAIQGTTPYIWSIYNGSLPAGLSLSTSGVLSGTPSGFGGTFNVIVRVQDQTGATNERQYTIVVSGDLSGRGKAKAGGCAAEDSGSNGMLALFAALAAAIATLRLARSRQ
jgi:hypothetical protein